MARKRRDRTDELLAELVQGKSPEEILGKDGVLKQLTKRLVENALEGEMTEHREGPHFSDSLLRWLRPAEDRRRSHEETTEIRA